MIFKHGVVCNVNMPVGLLSACYVYNLLAAPRKVFSLKSSMVFGKMSNVVSFIVESKPSSQPSMQHTYFGIFNNNFRATRFLSLPSGCITVFMDDKSVILATWGIAEELLLKGYLPQCLSCLEGLVNSGKLKSFSNLEIKTRNRIANILLKYTNNYDHAKEHYERAVSVIKF